MRKLLMAALVLSFAACLHAQENNKAAMTGIQGCLEYGHNHYTLVDKSGHKHMLVGNADKLKPRVGHEVLITGTETMRPAEHSMEGTASPTHQMEAFQVEKVKHISETCKAKM